MPMLGLAALILFLTASEAELPADDWVVERLSWDAPAASYQRIVFRNDHGDLRARFAGDDQVAVAAQVQHHHLDPDRAEISTAPVGRELRLAVRYVDGQAAAKPLPTEAVAKRRVDASIFVPAGLAYEAVTRQGLIEAKGIRGEVFAVSTTGDIVVSASGSIAAETESGAIMATLQRSDGDEPSRLRTRSGPITVLIPPDGDLLIEVVTGGTIVSDGVVSLAGSEEGGRRRALGRLGEGRRRLLIQSISGDVMLRNAEH